MFAVWQSRPANTPNPHFVKPVLTPVFTVWYVDSSGYNYRRKNPGSLRQ